jgi:hypothetical protein
MLHSSAHVDVRRYGVRKSTFFPGLALYQDPALAQRPGRSLDLTVVV